MQLQKIHIILYVQDQEISTAFYERLLQRSAELHVPGMSEFHLYDNCILGLMPSQGIVRLLGPALEHPDSAQGVARCELYLLVSDVEWAQQHALKCGAKLLSESALRSWGDRVCYVQDPDGHVIALASTT